MKSNARLGGHSAILSRSSEKERLIAGYDCLKITQFFADLFFGGHSRLIVNKWSSLNGAFSTGVSERK